MAQITLNSTGVASSGSLVLQSNGTTAAVTVNASQQVGIGVTPNHTSGKAIEIGNAGNGLINFAASENHLTTNAYYNSGWKFGGTGYAQKITTETGQYQFFVSTASGTAGNAVTFTQAMTLDASGNLLVGTTGAGARVYAVASGSQQAIRGDQSTAGAAAIYGLSSVNSGTGYVAYFTNTGSSTGLYISNTAAWQSTSDARLKTDVKDLDSSAKLLQLRPVDYLWKSQETSDEPTKRNLGFIAQEVKEVFPELVGVSPDGMFSVEYTGLIAPLVKAIQEQQALITQLQADVAALKA